VSRAGQPIIGFDRRVDREWLDAAVELLVAGAAPLEAREGLRIVLRPHLSGEKFNTALGKTLTVLMRVWVSVPAQDCRARDAALLLWPALGADERLALHWLMLLRAYPFFRDVALLAGRFLKLHDVVEVSLITRRMTESWGERSTVPRATQRVLRSMVQWGVLAETTKAGVYGAACPPRLVPAVGRWHAAGLSADDFAHGRPQRIDAYPFDLCLPSRPFLTSPSA